MLPPRAGAAISQAAHGGSTNLLEESIPGKVGKESQGWPSNKILRCPPIKVGPPPGVSVRPHDPLSTGGAFGKYLWLVTRTGPAFEYGRRNGWELM